MKNWLIRLMRDNRAATAVEYGLILALIAIAASGSIVLLANGVNGMWNYVSDEALTAL